MMVYDEHGSWWLMITHWAGGSATVQAVALVLPNHDAQVKGGGLIVMAR